jgi:hypothetical protein
MIKHIAKMKENYYAPTPKKWRQLGDALLAIALMGIPAELAGYKWIGLSLFIIGVVGKFLTNFFKDEENAQSNNRRGRRRKAD